MKAAFINQTGPPEIIQYDDLPDLQPGEGEVLVKVGAVAVNPIDIYIRSGAVALPLKFPFIVGCDLAGTVEAVGPAATNFQPGDRVWGSNQGLLGRRGTFAEYAAVSEQWLYPTPDQESDEQAAAGALVGITAHLGLFRTGRLQQGEIVFVNGGTGGVGSSVVQLAKAAGATVIATVGSPEKQAQCERLGADLVIDYHSPTMDDQIRQFVEPGGGINIWFETLREPNFDRTIDFLAAGGRMILMAGRDARPEFPVGPTYVKDLSILGFAMFNASAPEQQTCAMAINDLFTQGHWHPQIGKRLALADAAEAHQLQESHTLQQKGTLAGKIVLTLRSVSEINSRFLTQADGMPSVPTPRRRLGSERKQELVSDPFLNGTGGGLKWLRRDSRMLNVCLPNWVQKRSVKSHREALESFMITCARFARMLLERNFTLWLRHNPAALGRAAQLRTKIVHRRLPGVK